MAAEFEGDSGFTYFHNRFTPKLVSTIENHIQNKNTNTDIRIYWMVEAYLLQDAFGTALAEWRNLNVIIEEYSNPTVLFETFIGPIETYESLLINHLRFLRLQINALFASADRLSFCNINKGIFSNWFQITIKMAKSFEEIESFIFSSASSLPQLLSLISNLKDLLGKQQVVLPWLSTAQDQDHDEY